MRRSVWDRDHAAVNGNRDRQAGDATREQFVADRVRMRSGIGITGADDSRRSRHLRERVGSVNERQADDEHEPGETVRWYGSLHGGRIVPRIVNRSIRHRTDVISAADIRWNANLWK